MCEALVSIPSTAKRGSLQWRIRVLFLCQKKKTVILMG
jgi:hypothetical protein